MTTLECTSCGADINPREETHYRVGEEKRPAVFDDPDEPDFEGFFSRTWFLCESCFSEVTDDV